MSLHSLPSPSPRFLLHLQLNHPSIAAPQFTMASTLQLRARNVAVQTAGIHGNVVEDDYDDDDDEDEDDDGSGEDDDESLENYSFAGIYSGPRPVFVPKAQALSFSPKTVPSLAKPLKSTPSFLSALGDGTLADSQGKEAPPLVASYSSKCGPIKLQPNSASMLSMQPVDSTLDIFIRGNREDSSIASLSPSLEHFPSRTSVSTADGFIEPISNGSSNTRVHNKEFQVLKKCHGMASSSVSTELSHALQLGEGNSEQENTRATELNIRLRQGSPFPFQSGGGGSASSSRAQNVARGYSNQRKGECFECLKTSRMHERDTCFVCGATYCIKCLLKAMGSMPEGRKCVRCIGKSIDESRRSNLGKPSRLLNRLLSRLEVHEIMKAERECFANQISPDQIYVNGDQLSAKDLEILLTCKKPPSRLRPGRYWYDNECGYWGKEHEKPEQIITAALNIGGVLEESASAGCTRVYINGREITKLELKVLKFSGIQCLPGTRLWVNANGEYQDEGRNISLGNIWGKTRARFLSTLLSLPSPMHNVVAPESLKTIPVLKQKVDYKILLLGFTGSGTSAIFKQVRFQANNTYTPQEFNNMKFIIQSNIFKYITILLKAREKFECAQKLTETISVENKSSSGDIGKSAPKNIYTINERLIENANLFLEIEEKGEFDTFFPKAATEYAPIVEEMWKDPSIQATYKRRAELHRLPDVAKHFLDRVLEILSNDYCPSGSDILYAEGISYGLGLAEVEFSLPKSSGELQRNYNQNDEPVRFHLIRMNGNGIGNGCKWLDMFEGIDAVVFCVALDAYDLSWTDEKSSSQNIMILSRSLLENIIEYPCLRGKPVILFFNKYDAFRKKVAEIPLTNCEWFADFNPVSVSRSTPKIIAPLAYAYIAHKFKRHFEIVACRKVFTVKVNAWEWESVEEAFQYVNDVLIWERMKNDGSLSVPVTASVSISENDF